MSSPDELEPQTLDELADPDEATPKGSGAPAQNAPDRQGGGGRRRRRSSSKPKPKADDPPAKDGEENEDGDQAEELELGRVGIAAMTLESRRYSAQGAGSMVAYAGARAEGERGGPSDLIIVAVEPGRGLEVLDELRARYGASVPAGVDA